MPFTFATRFGRMGNLAALIKDETKVPECLKPYLKQLRSIFDPQPFEPEASNVFVSQRLSDEDLHQLVSRLNSVQSENRVWKSAADWSKLPTESQKNYSPVASRATSLTGVKHDGVLFTTYDQNPDNSVIHVISQSNNQVMFGKIKSIFTHERVPVLGQPPISETWLSVEYFAPVPPTMANPFSRLDEAYMQAHLRMEVTSKPYPTRLSEVVAHCAWIIYEEKEIHHLFNKRSVGLLSLER